MDEQTLQERYADLVLKKGVNIQKNQALVINAPIEGVEFVRLVAKKAYDLGAKNVHINWADDELTFLKYKHASDEVIENVPGWKVDMQEGFAEDGAAFLSIHATDPDLLKDIDPKRIAAANKAAGVALRKFREYTMNDIVTWSVISIPTRAWAQKIYPEKTADEAVSALWDTIYKMVRVDGEDPIEVWNKHNQRLENAFITLNDKQYTKLHLKAPGTDLEVGLPKGHIWHGGAAVSASNIIFNPNMPTEEVYTSPHKYHVNGTVSSTKPLNYGGQLIDEFQLTFKDGKVVDFQAKSGEEALKNLLDADEGARRLGEMALVPDASPISQSGLIFYNTLFDENASCHIALGKAYPTTVENGEDMSEEELDKNGINDSMVHVDFMIGSDKIDIDGIKADGTAEAVFRNGAWAFDI
ncbi:MAG TPA: aminopeptidase [Pseudogracilibacillus sp.]|nr:aminopeptidase [Pseudogracilibacillus sp.]